jgi:hypothetical protein
VAFHVEVALLLPMSKTSPILVSVEARLFDRMHGFLDLGSEKAPSTRGCRCTALVLRSRLEGLRCDAPFCTNLLIGAASPNVKIMSAVVKNDAWSRHSAVWIAECM